MTKVRYRAARAAKNSNPIGENKVVAWTTSFSLLRSLSLFSIKDSFAFVLPLHFIDTLNNIFAKRKMLSGNELLTGHSSACECVCWRGALLCLLLFSSDFFPSVSFPRIFSTFVVVSPFFAQRLPSSELSLHTPAPASLGLTNCLP